MRPANIKHLHSAGGVIFKKNEGIFEVALIATKKNTIWTLPKGIIDKGEQPEITAIREIAEETGLLGEIVEKIDDKTYWFFNKNENRKYKKTVSYFLLRYISGDIENFSWEVDDAKWFSIDEALKMVSYKTDKEVLKKAKEKLEQMDKKI